MGKWEERERRNGEQHSFSPAPPWVRSGSLEPTAAVALKAKACQGGHRVFQSDRIYRIVRIFFAFPEERQKVSFLCVLCALCERK